MSDHLQVTVRSNIDALSARVVHEALVATVDETMAGAEEFLRADRAGHTRRSQGGATVDHIRRDRAEGLAELVEARLGITPVIEKDDRPTYGRFRHSQAPIFVDEGTRSPIFASRPGGVMTNRAEGIFRRRSVRGQPGQHFMTKTYAEAQMLLRANDTLGAALEAMATVAAAEIPVEER